MEYSSGGTRDNCYVAVIMLAPLLHYVAFITCVLNYKLQRTDSVQQKPCRGWTGMDLSQCRKNAAFCNLCDHCHILAGAKEGGPMILSSSIVVRGCGTWTLDNCVQLCDLLRQLNLSVAAHARACMLTSCSRQ